MTDPRSSSVPSTQASDNVSVLYIAGPGRSGSTLLDTMLGQVDGFVSVGELRNLWVRGLKDGWPCGCGVPVRECPFWSSVLTEAFGSVEAISVEAMRGLQLQSVRTRHLPALWWHANHGSRPVAEDYGTVLSRLYRAIAEVSGARVIVDSSKHPSDAFVVSTLDGVRLHLLHLVRDPRGVAYSWSRPKDSTRESITLESQSILRCSVRWSVWNAAIAKVLAKRVDGRYLLMRYEDLIGDPGPANPTRVGAHGGGAWSQPGVGAPCHAGDDPYRVREPGAVCHRRNDPAARRTVDERDATR